MSQLTTSYDFILEKDRLSSTILPAGSNLAPRTAVTISARFQPPPLLTRDILQDGRSCLCSLRCRDEAGHQLLVGSTAACTQPARMCKSSELRWSTGTLSSDACFTSSAAGVSCQGASGGSWINEGLALGLKMEMSASNQNGNKIKSEHMQAELPLPCS